MKWTLTCLLPMLGILAWGPGQAGAADDKQGEKKGAVVKLDSLKSRVPADWVEEEPANRMRVYQFKVPRVKDDKTDAEMLIFSFGAQGGSAEENIKRWKGFFTAPPGKTIEDVSTVTKMKVGDAQVTYLDIHGTYKFKERPFDPSSKEELRPDTRFLGVVFETKKGPYFFRLVGPEKTVTQHKPGFDAWLKAFE
jgi:hypothetical protein